MTKVSAMKQSVLPALFVALFSAVAPACTFFAPPQSKVRAGELFEAAHPTYDPYFREVHQMQTVAAGWDDQKRTARRPLIDVLKIDPDAADVTVVQATHERVLGVAREAGNVKLEVTEGQARVVAQNASKVDDAGRAVFQAIEACVRGEFERGKSLRDVPAKTDALVKQGRALEPHVRDDLSRRGGRAPKQVMEELQASYEALSELSKSARLGAREADDFIADLRRGVGSDMAEAAARPSASAKPGQAKTKPPKVDGDTPPKPAPVTPKPPKPVELDAKPVAKPEPKPAADKPEPKLGPKPAVKEEFNP